MKELVSGDPQFVARWRDICDQQEGERRQWIASLRADGVVAAHPDDGWVNREESTIKFCYPQFNDGAEVGSIVALGWPDKHRLVRLTELRKTFLTERWAFEPITDHQESK